MIRIKKIGLMFFCLLGVFVLVACHSKDLDDENEAVKCEQTVIVFFPGRAMRRVATAYIRHFFIIW